MKIRIALATLCFLMVGLQDMNAQRGMKYHIDVDQIQKDVDLSDRQMEDIKRLKADIMSKMEEMKSSEDFDRDQMRAYKEQWKLEMDAILTVPQQEKLAAIKDERMTEMRAQKEVYMKEKMEKRKEVAAYKDKYVKPVMQEKRIELDKKISKDDKVKVDILRNIAKEERAEMEERFMKGDHPNGHPGKERHGKEHHTRGHHGKGPHGKGHHGKGHHIKKWAEENPETYQMAQDLVAKYSDDITEIQESMVQDRELWDSEMRAIMSSGETKKCDPKNCDPSNCDPKDCDPKNCDPSDCAPGKDSAKRKGRKHHGKKGRHLSQEEKSFAKQLHFLLMDVPETNERSFTATDFPELSAHPNPASTNQTLSLKLTENQKVSVTIIDASGKELMEVHKGRMDEGEHTLDVDLSSLPNNVYFYRVTTKSGSKLIQFIVARA